MACRICLRSSCTQSFHSIEEQDEYEEALDAYDDADYVKEQNNKEIELLQQQIEELESDTERAYEEAREIRARIEKEKQYD